MTRVLLALAVLFAPMVQTTAEAGGCHVVRRQAVFVDSFGIVTVPYAVPVATPVGVVAPDAVYSYRSAGYARPSAYDGASQGVTAAEWEEFKAWKASKASHATTTGLLSQKCASCHSAASPGAKSAAIAKLDLGKALNPEGRVAAGKAIKSGSMPPSGELSAEEVDGLFDELLGLK